MVFDISALVCSEYGVIGRMVALYIYIYIFDFYQADEEDSIKAEFKVSRNAGPIEITKQINALSMIV